MAALLAFGQVSDVHAATLTVVNTNDSGAGSLRQALIDAAAGDTIDFNAGLSGQTITLTSGELDIPRNITVTGPAGGITVSGNHSSRVFLVHLGVVVVMSNLTVADGIVNPPDAGGGFENEGTLKLANVTVRSNTADNGGGIYNGGTLQATNSAMIGNSATTGGGISNNGTLVLTDVTVSGNTASGGGGIQNLGNMTLANATVSGNTAEGGAVTFLPAHSFGGGILNFGPATLTNVTVSGNMARGTGTGDNFFGDGGGIFNAFDQMILTNTTVSANTAQGEAGSPGTFGSGGGIFNISGSMILTNTTVSGNTAHGDGSSSGFVGSGGGIFSMGGQGVAFFDCCSEIRLSSVTVSGNAAENGGGIFNASGCCGGVYGNPTTATPALYVTNTIVANQLSGMDCVPAGPITSLRYNLDSDGTCDLTAIGDLSDTDPMLEPLALNPPGTTETHALRTGSPAIDHIPFHVNGCGSGLQPRDQRGVTRPQGAGCDIGAYEWRLADAFPPVGGMVALAVPGSVTASSTLPVGLVGGAVLVALSGGWYIMRRRRT